MRGCKLRLGLGEFEETNAYSREFTRVRFLVVAEQIAPKILREATSGPFRLFEALSIQSRRQSAINYGTVLMIAGGQLIIRRKQERFWIASLTGRATGAWKQIGALIAQ